MLNAGEIIKAMRKQKGWSLRQTAEKAGVNYQTINRMETHKGMPTLYSFEQLLDAFGYELVIRRKR